MQMTTHTQNTLKLKGARTGTQLGRGVWNKNESGGGKCGVTTLVAYQRQYNIRYRKHVMQGDDIKLIGHKNVSWIYFLRMPTHSPSENVIHTKKLSANTQQKKTRLK